MTWKQDTKDLGPKARAVLKGKAPSRLAMSMMNPEDRELWESAYDEAAIWTNQRTLSMAGAFMESSGITSDADDDVVESWLLAHHVRHMSVADARTALEKARR